MTKSLVLSAFCLLLVCVSAEEPASDGSWAQDATLHVKDSEALSGMTATLVKKLNTVRDILIFGGKESRRIFFEQEKAQLDSNLEEARVAKVTAQEKLVWRSVLKETNKLSKHQRMRRLSRWRRLSMPKRFSSRRRKFWSRSCFL